MKIVVIGGTGLVGSKLVENLRAHGHEPLAASPDTGVNTITGEGLAEALDGAQVVVDVANAPDWSDDAVMEFFVTSTRNLMAAEAAAGVKHHVALSVVGADRLQESGYLRAKVAQEKVVESGAVPYTILRASQFFEFIGRLADTSIGGETVRLAPVLVQPESAADVAAALAEIAEEAPLNRVVELGGPEQFRLDELVQRVLRARNDQRRVVPDDHARYFGAELREHSLTPGKGARIAPTRFEEWLGRAVPTQKPTIVLVHGDWADASSWTAVIERLRDQGFTVVAPPNLLRGPSADAAYLSDFLRSISGSIVLVAHSYGGFVITNAATGNPNVKALVYIDSFMPDEGETLGAIAEAAGSCINQDALNAVPIDGGADLYLRWDANGSYGGFAECFANGVEPEQAAVLAAEQRPAAAAEFTEPSGSPAWRTIPSWSLIGTLDHVIPPALQEQMSSRAGARVSRVKAGHLTPITRPEEVTEVIVSAVDATS